MSRVFVLYTGGTIGMAPEDPAVKGSPLVPKSISELQAYLPKLGQLGVEIEYSSFATPLDSSDVGFENWVEMATRIADVYHEFDGFIVLHGTDTLAYTATALAFMFENLAKPVVVTGSQLPFSALRTDATMNFVNALHIAGYQAVNLACIPEVVVLFSNKILRGCRTRKVSSMAWSGFDSPNYPALGAVGEHITVNQKWVRPVPEPNQPFQVNTRFSDRVIDVSIFPGMKISHWRRMLESRDVEGVVLRTYGAGNAPGNPEFLNVIEEATNANKTIVNITQCMEGAVEMGRYVASLGLLRRGVISGFDMTPEAALIKLMWTLGTKEGDEVRVQMQVDQRGEQSTDVRSSC